MTIPGFVIFGPPRTKKNSGRIVQIGRKGSRKCPACGHKPGFPKLLPSEAHEVWFDQALPQFAGIRRGLAKAGVFLPVAGLLSVRALIYRETAVGDANGFYQAIGDLLQAAGIIANDDQIDDWDGSRRRKDKTKPRIEVFITVLVDPVVQEELPL